MLQTFQNEKEISDFLEQVQGAIVMKHNGEMKLFCIEDLAYQNTLCIYDAFTAIRIFHGKLPTDYGKKWLKYRSDAEQVSSRFLHINSIFKNFKNDLDKLNYVCSILGESDLISVPKTETENALQAYIKHNK